MKIVILDHFPLKEQKNKWKPISDLGELTLHDRTEPHQILERAKHADIIFTNKVPLQGSVLKKLPQLKYIGVLATGYNLIDLKTAKSLKIVVSNVPAYSTASVAQLVFSLLLESLNSISTHSQSVHQGDWTKCPDFSYTLKPLKELEQSILGIIGLGNIGRNVAQIAQAFGMKVIAYSRTKRPTSGVQFKDLDTLSRESDFISLHCPLNSETQKIIDSAFLKKMKKNAWLINTSRGPLIDEPALSHALNNNHIAGAALDVLSEEPPREDNPLLKAKNCIITPHIGWSTVESKERLIEISIQNLKAFIQKNPINQVQ
jgi:glycerate dehydrogenase